MVYNTCAFEKKLTLPGGHPVLGGNCDVTLTACQKNSSTQAKLGSWILSLHI